MNVLRKVRDVVRRASHDPGKGLGVGLAALQTGDSGRAREAFRDFLDRWPDGCERIVAAAADLADRGDRNEAEQLCRMALDLAPDQVQPYVSLARLLLAADPARAAEALAVIQQGVLVDSRSIDLHLLAASAHERLDQRVAATDLLKRVLELAPDHLDAARRLARLLDGLGDGPGSLGCWRQVVAVTRGADLEALTALGIGLSRDGQHDDAIRVLTEAAGRSNNASAAYGDLGMALLAANRLDEATGAFMRALEQNPRSAQAYCGVGLAYQKVGRWHLAIEAFTMMEQLTPALAAGPLNLGLTFEVLGDREQARNALLRAAAIDPNDREVLRALERVLASANLPDPGGPTSLAPARFGASITGDLKSFHLFDVLEFLRGHSKTGALVVSSPRGDGQVRLIRGAVTAAFAPGVKRLGETLLEHGLVSRATLDSVLIKRSREPANVTGESASLGNVLLREGLMGPERINRVVFEHILSVFEELLRWPEGAFSFRPCNDQEIPAISFELQQLTVELTRRKQ